MKPVIKTTREIGTTWELRTATSDPRSIDYTEMDQRNKTTSEFRTVLTIPWVSLIYRLHCILSHCEESIKTSPAKETSQGLDQNSYFSLAIYKIASRLSARLPSMQELSCVLIRFDV